MLNWLFEIELFLYIKMDLVLKNLQCMTYHKTKPNQTLAQSAEAVKYTDCTSTEG